MPQGPRCNLELKARRADLFAARRAGTQIGATAAAVEVQMACAVEPADLLALER